MLVLDGHGLVLLDNLFLVLRSRHLDEAKGVTCEGNDLSVERVVLGDSSLQIIGGAALGKASDEDSIAPPWGTLAGLVDDELTALALEIVLVLHGCLESLDCIELNKTNATGIETTLEAILEDARHLQWAILLKDLLKTFAGGLVRDVLHEEGLRLELGGHDVSGRTVSNRHSIFNPERWTCHGLLSYT